LLSKAGGVQPDMFQVDTIWLGEMADQGLAANLDSYYAKWADRSDVPDSFLESSKWKGSYYGLWAYSDTRTFIWNKDVFRKAGLDGMMLATVGDGWADSKLDGPAYKAKMGAAMPPLCDGCKPASAAGGWLFMMNSKSQYKDLVWEYMTTATATPNITPFEVKLVRVPVRKSGLAQAEAFRADPYNAVTVQAAGVSQFAPWVPAYYKVVEHIYT